jgi:hypothetical protein
MDGNELKAKLDELQRKIADLQEETDMLFSYHGRLPLRKQKAQWAKSE